MQCVSISALVRKPGDAKNNDTSSGYPYYAVLAGGGGGMTGCCELIAPGRELYQSIVRVKYMTAVTARKLATAPTSSALSSSLSNT